MTFWKLNLSSDIYDISYENLVDSQLSETKKLISFLGLDWQENCLYPEKNTNPVITASSVQVRKKVYKGSSDKWKVYEKFILKDCPSFASLDAD